jgi:hypothetical protein
MNGLKKDLSWCDCEDHPLNENEVLHRINQVRRKWSPVLGIDYPPMVKSVKYVLRAIK